MQPQPAAEHILMPQPEFITLEDYKPTPYNRVLLASLSTDILDTLHLAQQENHPERCLVKHTIRPILRAKMVDWMIEVLSNYMFSRRCFFLAVSLMDNYYQNATKVCDEQDVHLTGVTCMYMATKLEEVYPLRLMVVYSKIGHGVLSTNAIIEKEREILKVLNYEVMYTTSINILDMYMAMLVDYLDSVGEITEPETWDMFQKLKDGAATYQIMAKYDHDMLKFYPSTLAAGSIYAMAIKLSKVCSKKDEEIMIKAIKMFTSEEEGNVTEMEECARELMSLECEFERRFPGLLNLFRRELVP